MVQVMIWLSLLAELSLIDLDSIENLAEFCRTLLERVGNRPGMRDFALTYWLAGARMSIMRLNGRPLIEMILAPLFVCAEQQEKRSSSLSSTSPARKVGPKGSASKAGDDVSGSDLNFRCCLLRLL